MEPPPPPSPPAPAAAPPEEFGDLKSSLEVSVDFRKLSRRNPFRILYCPFSSVVVTMVVAVAAMVVVQWP